MNTRLLVSGALINGAEIELDGDRARYLSKVLRLRVGDQLNVFNGEGPEWPATVLRFSKQCVVLKLGESRPASKESPLKVHLVQSISRGERMDFVVQKATELGVKRITPVTSEYCMVKLDADRARKRRQHWEKIAAGACEQSGRTRPPLIDEPISLTTWVGQKPRSTGAQFILSPVAENTLAGSAGPELKVCLLIGPEGGFSDIETDNATAAGFEAVSLGPRILRTESAALAAVAVVQALWGDLS